MEPAGRSSRRSSPREDDDDYVHVEQRPPTLALEEEDLYLIPRNSASNSAGTSTSTGSKNTSKRSNVVSKMFFWKRNANAREKRDPTVTTGSGNVHNNNNNNKNNYPPLPQRQSQSFRHPNDRNDAVSMIALPPTSVASVVSSTEVVGSSFRHTTTTPLPRGTTTSRRATLNHYNHHHPQPQPQYHPSGTMGHTTTGTGTAVPNNTNTTTNTTKSKSTKVSLTSLLQAQTPPPTTTIESSSSISSRSNSVSVSVSAATLPTTTVAPPPKARNQLLPRATTTSQNHRRFPAKASSMIQLNSNTTPLLPSLSPAPARTAVRDPPTTLETVPTKTIEQLWRERQPQQPPPHDPDSPFSSKNSITTGSLHSSSTRKYHPTVESTTSSTNHNTGSSYHHHQSSKTPLLSSYQTNTPITKHYNISQQILHAFEMYYTSATAPPPSTLPQSDHHRQSHNNDDDDDEEDDNAFFVMTAYTIGVQYVETVLIEIPKHGYYYSKKHCKERLQSSINALHVGQLLLHLIAIKNNDHPTTTSRTTTTTTHPDPPAAPRPDKERNHIQNLIGIALTHIEQVTNAVCGGDPVTSTESTVATTKRSPHRSSSSSTATTGSWLEQQYHNSVSILTLSTVCCGHDLTTNPSPSSNGSPSTSVATLHTSPTTMLHPTVVASIIPILQGRSATLQESIHRSSSNSSSAGYGGRSKTNDRSLIPSKPDPLTSSSSSVFMTTTLEPEETGSTHRTPHRYVPRQNTISSINSHQSSTKTTPEEALMLEKALFLSGLEVTSSHGHHDLLDISTTSSRLTTEYHDQHYHIDTTSGSSYNNNNNTNATNSGSSSLELAILAQLYHEDFDSLQQSGRVRISYADTYQGRRNESTNGCTVIAPLVCIHHLINNSSSTSSGGGSGSSTVMMPCSDPGLTDSEIVMIIDQEAPSVLSELRESLGLAEHAFLIPADVHDYLIDQGQLSSSQFINVAGGNILNDEHLQAFISILEKSSYKDGTQKIGATLFFHEHVFTICKLHRTDSAGTPTRSWYDIIDSLPNPATLRRCSESRTDVYHRIGMFNATNVEGCMLNNMIPKTARIRCLDVDALCAVLKWYACSKFTAENISYIDQYPWDEQTCDFDPRVFQAFIWGSCTDDHR